MPQVFADDSNFVLRYYAQGEKIAVISFPLVNIFTFGSPNDEAISGHRLAKMASAYIVYMRCLILHGFRRLKNPIRFIRAMLKLTS